MMAAQSNREVFAISGTGKLLTHPGASGEYPNMPFSATTRCPTAIGLPGFAPQP
jgi:hypothetical protein